MKHWLFIFLLFTLIPGLTQAATEPQVPVTNWYQGKVLEVFDESSSFDETTGYTEQQQTVQVQVMTGPKAEEVIVIDYGGIVAVDVTQKLSPGDRVVISATDYNGKTNYAISDRYRLNTIFWVVAGFILVILILVGWRGARALAGLALTFLLLIWWIVPQIAQGSNPLVTSLIGAVVIGVTSIILAHGFNKRTLTAVLATLIVLLLAVGLSWFVTMILQLTGTASEGAWTLKLNNLPDANLYGLLLGGIIIGILGILDDVTTAQVAAVEQFQYVDKKLTWQELYWRSFSIGREHILALINTLVLAYVGVSLPLFILLTTTQYQPWWVTVNSEWIVEEIARGLIGSVVLMCAVPLTSLLAAAVYTRWPGASFTVKPPQTL